MDKLFNCIDNKTNIFLHGAGGCGKSFCLKQLAKYTRDKGIRFAYTATTGVAAENIIYWEEGIKSRTLHSWAGIGLARDDADTLVKRMSNGAIRKWQKTEYIMIDEVSMLGSGLFNKLDRIAKILRFSEEPFGGIKLILCGDFMQLAPVRDDWLFKSRAFKALKFSYFIFRESKRFDDINYFNLLSRARLGNLSDKDVRDLRKRVRTYEKMEEKILKSKKFDVVKPSFLYSRVDDVENKNREELKNCPGELISYEASDYSEYKKEKKSDSEDKISRFLATSAPKNIELKVGAQVMLTINLDIEKGLVNGTRGVVSNIKQVDAGQKPEIYVKFLNKQAMRMTEYRWEYEDKKIFCFRSQLPLKLAWAVTIHKGQGCTLDYAVCDIGSDIFTAGQAYTALSRVRNMRSLFLLSFFSDSVRADPDAKKFVDEIEKKGVVI